MQRELFLSLIIFIASFTGALSSYYAVIKQTHFDNTIVTNILPGIHNYRILENGKCTGSAGYELKASTNIYELKSHGKINIKYLNQKYAIDYQMESSFNSIGQMGGTILKINILDKYLVFGTVNIDPIKVSIKTNLLEKESEFSWEINGPVELIKAGNGSYNLTGLAFGKIRKDNITQLQNNSLFRLPLEFSESDSTECNENDISYFDISEYINSVKKLYSGYISL